LALCFEESKVYPGYHPHNEGKCLGGLPQNILPEKEKKYFTLIEKSYNKNGLVPYTIVSDKIKGYIIFHKVNDFSLQNINNELVKINKGERALCNFNENLTYSEGLQNINN
jgi:hypothetical protein